MDKDGIGHIEKSLKKKNQTTLFISWFEALRVRSSWHPHIFSAVERLGWKRMDSLGYMEDVSLWQTQISRDLCRMMALTLIKFYIFSKYW